MRFVVLAMLVALAMSELHPVNRAIVDEIKATATTWTPMEPEENPFAYKSVEEIKAMMGTTATSLIRPTNKQPSTMQIEGLPDSFDAREQWPGLINPIRDQAKCGSCWAFGAAEALSDRISISQNSPVVLSPQYLVSCEYGSYGCDGGYLDSAWDFIESNGIPTDSCVTYKSGSGDSGECPDACDDGSEPEFYTAEPYEQFTTQN